VELSLDDTMQDRLRQVAALGASRMRPLGLEADRAGGPIAPEHPFFAELVAGGFGRTRWSGEIGGDASAVSPGTAGSGARAAVVLAE